MMLPYVLINNVKGHENIHNNMKGHEDIHNKHIAKNTIISVLRVCLEHKSIV